MPIRGTWAAIWDRAGLQNRPARFNPSAARNHTQFLCREGWALPGLISLELFGSTPTPATRTATSRLPVSIQRRRPDKPVVGIHEQIVRDGGG